MLMCAISHIVHALALHTTWTQIVVTIGGSNVGGDMVGEDAGVWDDNDNVEHNFLQHMTGVGL